MSPERFVYLDYAASAPLREEAIEAQRDYRARGFSCANPNSLHTLGRQAARALDGARGDVASCLGGGFRPSDVAFTSGGTESNNLALYGMAEGMRERDRRRDKVVISAIEHDSVLDLAPALRGRGFETVAVRPGRDGVVSPESVRDVVDGRTALVSVMYANNETGAVQPVAELAEIAHAVGALVHTDAVQAFGRIPLALAGVDAASVAGHKIGAPVGTGVLAMRGRCPFRPQTFGGGQESGRRPGTQDVCGAVVLAAVSRLVCGTLGETRAAVQARANHVYERLCAPGTNVLPTTTPVVDDGRLPGIVSVMVPGIDSERLILDLDARGFEVSAGSACSSASLDPSHVLSAMGIPREQALGSLRISFDERVPLADLDSFCDALVDVASSPDAATRA